MSTTQLGLMSHPVVSSTDSQSNNQEHSLEVPIYRKGTKSVLLGNVLGYRIVNLWNSLPKDAVHSNSQKECFDHHCAHMHFSYVYEYFRF